MPSKQVYLRKKVTRKNGTKIVGTGKRTAKGVIVGEVFLGPTSDGNLSKVRVVAKKKVNFDKYVI